MDVCNGKALPQPSDFLVTDLDPDILDRCGIRLEKDLSVDYTAKSARDVRRTLRRKNDPDLLTAACPANSVEVAQSLQRSVTVIELMDLINDDQYGDV